MIICIIFCSIIMKNFYRVFLISIWRMQYKQHVYDENNIVRVSAYLHIYSSGRAMTMTATTISSKASNRPCWRIMYRDTSHWVAIPICWRISVQRRVNLPQLSSIAFNHLIYWRRQDVDVNCHVSQVTTKLCSILIAS